MSCRHSWFSLSPIGVFGALPLAIGTTGRDLFGSPGWTAADRHSRHKKTRVRMAIWPFRANLPDRHRRYTQAVPKYRAAGCPGTSGGIPPDNGPMPSVGARRPPGSGPRSPPEVGSCIDTCVRMPPKQSRPMAWPPLGFSRCAASRFTAPVAWPRHPRRPRPPSRACRVAPIFIGLIGAKWPEHPRAPLIVIRDEPGWAGATGASVPCHRFRTAKGRVFR